MPNRILRDWTDSITIDNLSWQEEVLFTRLIMKADDFGNFYRDGSLVKSLLFPRKDGLRASDINRWLKNLEAADLIRCYPAKGDTFLHIRNFGQRLDRTNRKFPEEPASINDDNHSPRIAADGSESPPETKRNETEEETETRKGSRKKHTLHFFYDSEIFDKKVFKEKVAGTQYEHANLDYYHEVINNWSASKEKNKKSDWLATAKNWMAGDMRDGKFVTVNFTPNGQSVNQTRAGAGAKLTGEQLHDAAAKRMEKM